MRGLIYDRKQPPKCPGCWHCNWLIGRITATCAFCENVIPLDEGGMSKVPSSFARIADMIPEGIYWQYRTAIRDGRLHHTWSISGDRGGIHVDAWRSETGAFGREWYGGIEAHSPIKDRDWGSEKPDHEHCWLLCGPCWHDGSSLQFSEQISPYLPHEDRVMGDREHCDVMIAMLNRYTSWLPTASAIEARRAETKRLGAQHESAVAKGETPVTHCIPENTHDASN